MVQIFCLIMSSRCSNVTVIPDNMLIAIELNESFILAKMESRELTKLTNSTPS